MAKCQFCGRGGRGETVDVKAWDNKISKHVVVTKDVGGHIHIHGPNTDRAFLLESIRAICNHGADTKEDITPQASVVKGKCQFCTNDEVVEDWEAGVSEHLIITKKGQHIHAHGPFEKKEVIEEFITAIYDRAGIILPQREAISGAAATESFPDKAVFKNRQAIGDILTMTCAVRDIKTMYPSMKIGVSTTAMHIWDNNPFIEHGYNTAEDILNVGPGHLTTKSNKWNLHMCNAFRMDIENKLGIPIIQGDIKPDIWMTEEEYNRPPLISGPYWVIIVGGEPGWTAKMYPAKRWQTVINQLGHKIQFVQLGMARHPYAHLDNVIDYIGKTEDKDTGLRDLFNIFLHAQGSVGLVSMHMHLSAVFNNPCVVVAGAREPAWFTHYKGHQYLETTGTLPCAQESICWKCDVKGCKAQENGVPKCVDIIRPDEIVKAIERYYDGGRLEYNKKIPRQIEEDGRIVKKDFFKNIIKGRKASQAIVDVGEVDLPQKYGFGEWGGSSVTNRDWEFMKQIISDKGIKTVIEFGTGLSTFLMSEMVEQIVSFDNKEGWVRELLVKASAARIPFKNMRLR